MISITHYSGFIAISILSTGMRATVSSIEYFISPITREASLSTGAHVWMAENGEFTGERTIGAVMPV